MPFSIDVVENRGDDRGDAFAVPSEALEFLGAVTEAHFVTVRPGKTRGNHHHEGWDEVLMVTVPARCRVAWQEDGVTLTRDFTGPSLLTLRIPHGVTHAVKNTGTGDLHLASFSNKRTDAPEGETHRRVILE